MEKKDIKHQTIANFEKLSEVMDADLLALTDVGKFVDQKTIDDLAEQIKSSKLDDIRREIGFYVSNAMLTFYKFGNYATVTKLDYRGEYPVTIYSRKMNVNSENNQPSTSHIYIETEANNLYINSDHEFVKRSKKFGSKGKVNLIDKHSHLGLKKHEDPKEIDRFVEVLYQK